MDEKLRKLIARHCPTTEKAFFGRRYHVPEYRSNCPAARTPVDRGPRPELGPVPNRINTLRSPIAIAAIHSRKTHCPQGHPYSFENILFYGPNKRWRMCRICHRKYQKEAYARTKQGWRLKRRGHGPDHEDANN